MRLLPVARNEATDLPERRPPIQDPPQLQGILIKVDNSLDRAVIKAACESFWKRVDWAKETKGL